MSPPPTSITSSEIWTCRSKTGKVSDVCTLSVMLCFVLATTTGFSFFSPTWQQINKHIRHTFPTVTNMSAQQLAQLLINSEVMLLDVRSREEFNVSTIRGAKNLTHPDAVNARQSQTIVVFCSVGIRSASFVQQLQKKGYTNVFNLQGSLFEWANMGYPVFQGGKPTYAVHPYNKRWGKLLRADLHSYTPIHDSEP